MEWQMKIKVSHLRQIIKEEVTRILKEDDDDASDTPPSWFKKFQSDHKDFYKEGDRLVGIGNMKGSQNMNMLQVAAEARAKKVILRGINPTSPPSNLVGSKLEGTFLKDGTMYAKVSAPSSQG